MKPIKGFENYQITTEGRIYSIKTKKWIKPSFDKYGYLQVCLKSTKYFSFRVHRLVAITYLGLSDYNNIVNHINGIKTDNRVENLEWVTQKQNVKHSWGLGLSEKIRESNSKIVLDVKTGVFYNSAKEASIYSNFAYSTIRSMLNGGLKNNTSLVYV
jgi:hypothetical protein